MSLPETVSFDKEGRVVWASFVRKFFLSLTIILVAGLSFGLGRLSIEGNREPVRIEYDSKQVSQIPQPVTNNNKAQTAAVVNSNSGGEVYASSKGVRYYYLHCKSTVSEKNKVIFASASLAESAGYTLAANCKSR